MSTPDLNAPVCLMFLGRRHPSLSREEFSQRWKSEFGSLVKKNMKGLNAIRYEQWHYVNSSNSPKKIRNMSVDPKDEYDFVDMLWYKNSQSGNGDFDDSEMLKVEKNLLDLKRCSVMIAQPRHRFSAESFSTLSKLSKPGLRVVFPLKRKQDPNISSDVAFYHRWRHIHGPLVDSVAPQYGGQRYEQMHRIYTPTKMMKKRGISEVFDGYAIAWSDDSKIKDINNARKAVNTLLADEQQFLDLPGSNYFMAECQFECGELERSKL